jgi:hypothetical protein
MSEMCVYNSFAYQMIGSGFNFSYGGLNEPYNRNYRTRTDQYRRPEELHLCVLEFCLSAQLLLYPSSFHSVRSRSPC